MTAPRCTCDPGPEGQHQTDRCDLATADGYANWCRHDSATGIDTTPLDDPAKVWRCDHCGLTWAAGGAA